MPDGLDPLHADSGALPTLVEQGFSNFNLVRFANGYYAVPATAGQFNALLAAKAAYLSARDLDSLKIRIAEFSTRPEKERANYEMKLYLRNKWLSWTRTTDPAAVLRSQGTIFVDESEPDVVAKSSDARVIVRGYRGYALLALGAGETTAYVGWRHDAGKFDPASHSWPDDGNRVEAKSVVGLKLAIDRRLGGPSAAIDPTVDWATLQRRELLLNRPLAFPLQTLRHDDYDLVVEGYRQHNIVHAYGLYYGWPWSGAGFTIARFLDTQIAPDAVVGISLHEAKALVDLKRGRPTPEEENRLEGSVPSRPLDWNDTTAYEAIFYNRFKANDAARRGLPVVDAKPPFVIASTAFGCNIECKMCYLLGEDFLAYDGPYGRKKMTDETWKEVTALVPTTQTALMTVEGEILVHKEWFDRWLELARSHPSLKLGFQTNAMIMNQKVVDMVMDNPAIIHIAISIDGATPEVNDNIRTRSKLDIIFKHMSLLVEAKQKLGRRLPNLHTHFVMMRENIHELPLYLEKMHQLGVNSMTARHIIARRREDIAQALYFDQERADHYILEARKIKEKYGLNAGLPDTFAESRAKGTKRRPDCYDPWLHGQILHDGSVWSCCNNAVKMGNINEPGGFDAVWNNEKYQKLRQVVNTDNPHFTACKYCYAMLPVHAFEAFIETRVLFKILDQGGVDLLQEWCPGPIELMVQPGEKYVD